MCGIVGLASKNSSGFDLTGSDLFTDLLQMDSIRGKDSTGAFGVSKLGEIDFIKGNTNAWEFTSCKNYTDFKRRIYSTYQIVIGHNRAATKGAISPENAHPFKDDHIIGVHNGTIWNQEELAVDTEVDSHAIMKALAKADAATALNLVNGPFALVWFDAKQKTLNLARNKDRPLFLLEYDKYWTIASEPGLPYWLNGRQGKKLVGTPLLVPIEKIIQFDLDALDKGFKEIEFSNYQYKSVIPMWNNYHHYPETTTTTTTKVKAITDLTASSPVKQGDEITFNIDDIKHEDGDTSYTIFGYPIFDREMNTNILVKAEIPTKQELDAIQATGYGKGTVTQTTNAAGMPVLMVRFVVPTTIFSKKETTVDEDIRAAIASGCGRCKGAMSFVDIASSIVRKKKDGTYRTLCKKCLEIAIANIPERKIVAN